MLRNKRAGYSTQMGVMLWNKRAGYSTQMGVMLRNKRAGYSTQMGVMLRSGTLRSRDRYLATKLGPTRCPETSVTTDLGSITSQRSDDLKDTAPEA